MTRYIYTRQDLDNTNNGNNNLTGINNILHKAIPITITINEEKNEQSKRI